MIRTVNQNLEFLFVNPSNIKCFAPPKTRIYVYFQDNGQGKYLANGRVDRLEREAVPATETHPEVPAFYVEMGYIRTTTDIPVNDPEAFAKGHQAVITTIQELNPEIEFEIY